MYWTEKPGVSIYHEQKTGQNPVLVTGLDADQNTTPNS